LRHISVGAERRAEIGSPFGSSAHAIEDIAPGKSVETIVNDEGFDAS
jgi:hypothetical protein